jgi:hypothetical protein
MALTKVRGSGIDADGQEIILDSDGDTTITADTDDKIDFKTAGSDRLQIDASGRLLLGTTTPSGYANRMMTVSGNVDATLEIRASSTSGHSQLVFSDGTAADNTSQRGYIIYDHADETFKFGVYDRQFMEATTFGSTDSTSHNRLATGYNHTSAGTNNRQFGFHVGGHRYYHPAMMVEDHDSATSYATTLIQFFRNGSDCGEITATTSTTYSTSSDYRLKTDIQDMDSASETIKKLKPRKYKWKANENIDGYTNPHVNGFIAHEVQEVIPNANDMGIVTGTKDKTEEVENVVFDAKGAIAHLNVTEDAWKTGKADGTYASDTTWKAKHDKVKAQGIDYSRFTPLLVKSLQEALARIETLEAKVKALEEA